MKRFLWFCITVRWLWFLTAEHIEKLSLWIDNAVGTLMAGPVGAWLNGFGIGEKLPWLPQLWRMFWYALLWLIPLLLIAVRLLSRSLPGLKKLICRLRDRLDSLKPPPAANETHIIVRIIAPTEAQGLSRLIGSPPPQQVIRPRECCVDLGELRSVDISKENRLRIEGESVFLECGSSQPYMLQPGRWEKTPDGYRVKLLNVEI